MARNHYTRRVREAEREQIAKQEKELEQLTPKLRSQDDDEPDTEKSFKPKGKIRRCARRAQNKRHKPERFRNGGDQPS